MAASSPHLLVGLLGSLAAGRGFVPLDPEYPEERLALMIEDCRLRVLLTDRVHLAKATEVAARSSVVEHVVCLDGEVEPAAVGRVRVHGLKELAAARPRQCEPPAVPAGEGAAYVIYTSGSTGAPKGVPITHRNLVPLLLWSRDYFGFGTHTRVLQSLSYAFDFGVFEILTTLLFGGTLHLLDGAERSDVHGYVGQVERQEINTLHTTPAFFRAMAAVGGDLQSVQLLHLGGEQLNDPLVDQALAATGDGCVVYNGYGPTEATINCAIFAVGTRASRSGQGLSSVPIGRPSAANLLYVLDGAARLAPIGVPGELCVGGPGVSRGYLNRPELTAERFVPHPFARPAGDAEGPGSRLYRTGDLVRCREDGSFEFLGRRDQQVKIRGYRIELGEVEAALAGHPALCEAAVLAHPRPTGDPQLVAYLVAAGPAPDGEELRRFLARRLPPYMVPAAFVALPELPRTATGKLDRRALPAPEEAPGGTAAVAPRTPVEELLVGIWCRCLEVERVGVHDNFFALGGHSLLATQVVSHIRRALGVELPLATFFTSPTVAQLALAVEGAGRAELAPIPPAPRDRDLPLSFAQERLWFLAQLEPESLAYNVPRVVEIRGRYDPVAMELAYGELVARHEVLRTVLVPTEAQPVQRILPPRPFRMLRVDLCSLPRAAGQGELERLIQAEVRHPFDLVRGPLLRAVLVCLDEAEFVQIQTEHHLVHDGWTQGVLLDDLLALYTGFYTGRKVVLPPLPIQYADYAVWQRQWMQGEVLEAELAYWRHQLAGMPPVLELPTDRPRPSVLRQRGSTRWFTFSRELLADLTALSRRLDVTLFMTLLATFQALVSRYAGIEDIVVGSPIANRSHPETEGLIGFFVNTLLLRTDLSGAPRTAELLERVRAMALGAYAHQYLPYEKLVEELAPQRDLAYIPLCQVVFILQNAPLPPLRLPDATLRQLDVHNGTAKFDLMISLQEREGELTGWLEYSTDLFDGATIQRFQGHLENLLHSVVRQPERPVRELPLLGPEERQALVCEWNDAAGTAEPPASLPPLLAARAARHPEAVALIDARGQMSYGELAARSGRLARRLHGLGVGPETRVAVLLEPSLQRVVALWAVLEAGGAYVPLDPAYPTERMATILADAAVGCVLTDGALAARLPATTAAVLHLDAAAEAEAEVGTALPCPAQPENLAYMLYTSGSTGRPKGVEIVHRALVNVLRSIARRPGFSAADTLVACTTITFDIATLDVFLPLLCGGRAVLVDRETVRDARQLLGVLAAHQPTLLQATPATWSALLEAGWRGEPPLRVMCAGEALSRALADRLLGATRELWNLYGPTETAVYSVFDRVPAEPGPVLIGGPVDNTLLYVVDPDLRLVPAGVPGELLIGGLGLGRGYRGRPDWTAASFVPDPLGGTPGARLYRTGDLVRRLTDGRIEFLGRRDQQIKLRGFRIELGEIESVLRHHPAVAASAVALVHEPILGPRLAAYVVPRLPEGDAVAAATLDQWREVWEDTYGSAQPAASPSFNLVGWTSSYSGEAIAAEEMAEWVDGTVERILALRPRRVLEIGCGTGLLLFRIAPHCERYDATDFSTEAVAGLRRQVAAAEGALSHVGLWVGAADRLPLAGAGTYDVVVLNSVVQYFPSLDYLLEVLRQAAALVRPGGAIFLGDLRSQPLLPALRASVLLRQLADRLTLGELKRQLAVQVARERELVIDPRLFSHLAGQLPGIDRLTVELHRGRFHNELTKYRYDAILHSAGEAPEEPSGAPPELVLDWQEERLTLPELTRRAAEALAAGRALAVRRIPNARLVEEVELLRRLEASNGDALPTVGEIRRALRTGVPTSSAVDPELLWGLGETLAANVVVRGSDGPAFGCCDAVFHPRLARVGEPLARQGGLPDGLFERYANRPYLARTGSSPEPAALSEFLRHRLPAYMIPSAYVFLDTLPLTGSGKLDRRALPDLASAAASAQTDFVPPRTAVESLLAGMWSQVLGMERVGIHEDFFALGGHSLLATQLLARVRSTFRVEIPLRRLFDTRTVAALAQVVTAEEARPGQAEAMAQLLEKVRSLSPDELQRELQSRRPAGGAA